MVFSFFFFQKVGSQINFVSDPSKLTERVNLLTDCLTDCLDLPDGIVAYNWVTFASRGDGVVGLGGGVHEYSDVDN